MLLRVSSAAHPVSLLLHRESSQAKPRSVQHSCFNFTLPLNKLLHFSFIFLRKKCKLYAECLQLFVQGRMGVSVLSKILNISKANNVDLFHSLSSVCFSKPAEQHRSRTILQGRRICSEKIAKKKPLNTFFCSSEWNKHIFNHILLQLAFNKAAALISFLFIFCGGLFQK